MKMQADACNFIKKETLAQDLFLRTPIFIEHQQATASGLWLILYCFRRR